MQEAHYYKRLYRTRQLEPGFEKNCDILLKNQDLKGNNQYDPVHSNKPGYMLT